MPVYKGSDNLSKILLGYLIITHGYIGYDLFFRADFKHDEAVLEKILLNIPTGTSDISLGSFGYTISVNKNYVLISASTETFEDYKRGVVHLYNVNTNQLIYSIENPEIGNYENHDFFGQGVGIYGNYMVVSTYRDNTSANGAVYVFNTTTGKLLRKITAPAGCVSQFGRTLCINGNILVSSGDTYIYKINVSTGVVDTSFAYEATINAPYGLQTNGALILAGSRLYTWDGADLGDLKAYHKDLYYDSKYSPDSYSATVDAFRKTGINFFKDTLRGFWGISDKPIVVLDGPESEYTTYMPGITYEGNANKAYLFVEEFRANRTFWSNTLFWIGSIDNVYVMESTTWPVIFPNWDSNNYYDTPTLVRGDGNYFEELWLATGYTYIKTDPVTQSIAVPFQVPTYHPLSEKGEAHPSGVTALKLWYYINNPPIIGVNFYSVAYASSISARDQGNYETWFTTEYVNSGFEDTYDEVRNIDVFIQDGLFFLTYDLIIYNTPEDDVYPITRQIDQYFDLNGTLRWFMYDCGYIPGATEFPSGGLYFTPPIKGWLTDDTVIGIGTKRTPITDTDGSLDNWLHVVSYNGDEIDSIVTYDENFNPIAQYSNDLYPVINNVIHNSDGVFCGVEDTIGNFIIIQDGVELKVDNTDNITEYMYAKGLFCFYSSGNGNLYKYSGGSEVTIKNPGHYIQTEDEQYGTSVYADDTYLIVGTPNKRGDNNSIVGSIEIYDISTKELLHRIMNPLGANTGFGTSVYIHNGWCYVGAPYNGDGSVYVFQITTGYLIDTIYPSETTQNFGTKVVINDDILVISACLSSSAVGKIFLYSLGHVPLFVFTNPSSNKSTTQDYFGSALAITDGYILVGDPGEATRGAWDGKAYLYSYSTYQLAQTIDNPNVVADGDLFGSAVTIDNERAVISAPWKTIGTMYGDFWGELHVFTLTSGTLVSERIIQYPYEEWNSGYHDAFGESLALFGKYVLVGAWGSYEDPAVYDQNIGLVNILTGDLEYTITIYDTTNFYSDWGAWYPTLAITEKHLVIGAIELGETTGAKTGAVYIYKK